jgi:hypothetical protein
MSQSRKKNISRSKQGSRSRPKTTNQNDPSDVLKHFDNLTTNIKEENRKISAGTTNNNRLIGAVFIIIISMSGVLVLYQLNIFGGGPNGGGPTGNGTDIITTIGGYKQDLAAAPLFISGKLSIVYVGGEFCPYCGVQRWAIIDALSNFGIFSGLTQLYSSESDIPTYTFAGSSFSYTSDIIDFQPVEVFDQEQKPFETMNTLQRDLTTRYGTGGSIPFLCIGGSIFKIGAGSVFSLETFSPLTVEQIQSQVSAKSGAAYSQINSESSTIQSLINQLLATKTTSAASI